MGRFELKNSAILKKNERERNFDMHYLGYYVYAKAVSTIKSGKYYGGLFPVELILTGIYGIE